MKRTMLLLIAIFAVTSDVRAQRVGVGSYGKAVGAPARDPEKVNAGIDQNLGGQVDLGLVFRDEHDNPITLGQAMNGKPTILVLAYFRCQQLCNQVLNDLVEALREVPYDVGEKFNVVVVSFDPKDRPVIAYGKKMSYVQMYGRPGSENGFRFLTGEQGSIDALCQTVGFRYEYDSKLKEYFHASGVMILNADGIISRYFFGLKYNAADIRFGLTESSEGKIGSFQDRALLLLCMRYDAHTGKYSGSVMMILRAAAAVTVLIVGIWVLRVWTRGRNRKTPQNAEPQAVA